MSSRAARALKAIPLSARQSLELAEHVQPQSRRLLRALLREASYLPDELARTYFRQHILDRFRAYHPGDEASLQKLIDLKGGLERQTELRRSGWKSVRQLQRASTGHHPSLFRVLLMTYGRIGKRKHELLHEIRDAAPEPTAIGLMAQLTRRPNIPSHVLDSLPRPNAALEALLKSQVKTRPSDDLRHNIKDGLRLNIPELNVWHRPFPVKRVVNKVRKSNSTWLSKVLPPLPKGEWLALERLALGQTECPGTVRRRPLGTSTGEGAVSVQDLSSKLSYPGPPEGSSLRCDDTLLLGKLPSWLDGKRGSAHKPHVMDARFMMHTYREIFKLCPFMEWDPRRTTWTVTWGIGSTKKHHQKVASRNARFLPYIQAAGAGTDTS